MPLDDSIKRQILTDEIRKIGKKKVKAVARALKSVSQTPKISGRQLPSTLLASAFQSPIRNHTHLSSAEVTPDNRDSGLTSYGSSKPTLQGSQRASSFLPTAQRSPQKPAEDVIPEEQDQTTPLTIPRRASTQITGEESTTAWESGALTNYGSFVPSPNQHKILMGPPSLELPDPALSPEEESFARHNRAWRQTRFNPNPHTTPPSIEGRPGDAYAIGKTHSPAKHDSSHLLPKRQLFRSRRALSTPGFTPLTRPRLMKRLFSHSGHNPSQKGDVPLEAYRELDTRQAEFLEFLDKELEKIESFYKMKEAQASTRLQVLREQLHEMRDRRTHEIRAEQFAKEQLDRQHKNSNTDHTHFHNGLEGQFSSAARWMKPIESAIGTRPARIGKTSKYLPEHTSPPGPKAQRPEEWRDFTRRPHYADDVPYRSAKRKLKLALQEFYRGLELLKAYALTNRTAFRKINKKFDKAVNARPTQRYMSEKVNKAWFVQSEVLEAQIVAVEDLYARYFERGNHKVAVGKLRSKSSKAGDFTGSVFRNGLMLAAGAVFGVQGIVYGAEHLYDSDTTTRLNTSYLLQVYGGYFLGLFLFLLFCADCKIWAGAKINYPFIFEFDPRHNLDWQQLSELPSFFFFLLGLCIWLNFQQEGANAMFLYWPVILIGITLVIILLPAPILYHQSREWWAYSNFRLLLAGIYPVEFRDFFLGDMYCSQTYSMGNIELFFCLYVRDFDNPAQCNSSHSRLLGFFSTLPGIWRGLQCLRRYYDTRNAFPHLANCAKYTFTVLFYMTLSLYRIDKTHPLKALFITCATINSVYCSIWDLAMDWSLCNYYAEHVLLRNVLGFKRPWVYYLAMIIDPILRFNWIFYAIFSQDVQHSALLSFFVAFSEVCRRGIWSIFRVENEHCTNVGRFRASRDVPLPYSLEAPASPSPSSDSQGKTFNTTPHQPSDQDPETAYQPSQPDMPQSTAVDAAVATSTSSHLEAQPSSTSLRRRFTPTNTPVARGIARVGTLMTEAHAQDFERRRRPGAPLRSASGIANAFTSGRVGGRTDGAEIEVGLERSPHHDGRTVSGDSSDEEEEEEYEDEREEGEKLDREEEAEVKQATADAGGPSHSERNVAFVNAGTDADAGPEQSSSRTRGKRSDVR